MAPPRGALSGHSNQHRVPPFLSVFCLALISSGSCSLLLWTGTAAIRGERGTWTGTSTERRRVTPNKALTRFCVRNLRPACMQSLSHMYPDAAVSTWLLAATAFPTAVNAHNPTTGPMAAPVYNRHFYHPLASCEETEAVSRLQRRINSTYALDSLRPLSTRHVEAMVPRREPDLLSQTRLSKFAVSAFLHCRFASESHPTSLGSVPQCARYRDTASHG